MELPKEYLMRGGGKAIVYTDAGDEERILVGAYWTGTGWHPCSWLGTGRFHPDHFTALDLLIQSAMP